MKNGIFDLGMLLLRVAFGAAMAYHGYQKIFGGMMPQFVEGVGKMGFPMPEVFAWAAALSEFAGGIFLALGLFGRFAAFFIAVTMAVAAFVALSAKPLSDKELALAYLVISSAFVMMGPGALSVDGMRKGKSRK